MSYVLYGAINTKIVGVRYYNGHANVGEIAVPRREPNNQYDSKYARSEQQYWKVDLPVLNKGMQSKY